MELKVIIEKGLDGFIVVSCPALKGCWSQGKTEKEALANIRKAIALYLEPDPKIKRSTNRKIIRLTV